MAETLGKGTTPRRPFDLRRLRLWLLSVRRIDRPAVVARIDAGAGFSAQYAFMVLMSAGVAVLGLLQSSPAVVIGAMLISPLMAPIVALGFAFAVFDWREVGRSMVTLLAGSALAIGFCALIVWASPLQEATPEILARTRPNLFDLLVAVFAALAGTYATMRQQGETVVGAAIATALMPPLATIGFGIATGNAAIAGGAAALFVTNFVAIALSAAVLARLFGFGAELSPHQTRLQSLLVLVVLGLLTVPLGFSLVRIATEAVASGRVRGAIADYFGPDSQIVRLDFDFSATPAHAFAVVTTSNYHPDGANVAARAAERAAGYPFAVTVNQIVVGREVSRMGESAIARLLPGFTGANDVTTAVAAVAGVPPSAVLVDRAARRVAVAARADPGVDLAGWRALEARLGAANPGWTITLAPPLQSLAPLLFDDRAAALDPTQVTTVETYAWALTRWNVAGVIVDGAHARGEPAALALERASAVAEMLRARSVAAKVTTSGAKSRSVTLQLPGGST